MSAEASTIWYLAHAAQWALGVVFLLAAVGKVRDPAAFVRAVDGYRLLPRRAVGAVAWGLIGLEGLLAVLLLGGWLFEVAGPLAVGVLSVFVGAVAINLRRGRRVRCGCFGSSEEVLSERTVARLGLLLGTAVLVLVLDLAGVTEPLTAAGVVNAPSYGLLAAMLAAFVLIIGNWLLDLPGLATALRGLARSPAAPAATTRDEV